MYKAARKYGVVELVNLMVKLLAPVLDAWRDETGHTVKVETEPTILPTTPAPAAVAPVVEEKKVVKPISLPVIPAPVLLILGVISRPSSTTRSKTKKAKKTASKKMAAKSQTWVARIAPATPEVLYRRAKRGDRYEVAQNPQPGEQLFTRVRSGKRFRYVPIVKKFLEI